MKHEIRLTTKTGKMVKVGKYEVLGFIKEDGKAYVTRLYDEKTDNYYFPYEYLPKHNVSTNVKGWYTVETLRRKLNNEKISLY